MPGRFWSPVFQPRPLLRPCPPGTIGRVQIRGPGVITERDILRSISKGGDPNQELVANHLTKELTFAAPDWSLERAAVAMVRGGFRHLVVVEGRELVGMLSMRDIVRCWTADGATSEVPAGAAEA